MDLSLSSEPEMSGANLVVKNCANKGKISVSSSNGCGMFCVEPSKAQHLTSFVVNSVNKGELKSGANVYGAANIISKADNFVSMGKLTASSDAFSFWNECTDVGRAYCLKSTCSKCDYATQFEYQSSKKTYNVVGSGEKVHDVLTFQARKMRYGMVWTNELELVYGEMPPATSETSPPSSGVIHVLSPLAILLMVILIFIMTNF